MGNSHIFTLLSLRHSDNHSCSADPHCATICIFHSTPSCNLPLLSPGDVAPPLAPPARHLDGEAQLPQDPRPPMPSLLWLRSLHASQGNFWLLYAFPLLPHPVTPQDRSMLSAPHRVMHTLAQVYGPVMRVGRAKACD